MKGLSRAARVRLAPGVPDLAALGAEAPEDLFAGEPAPSARAELISADRESELWRCALPGTPDASGRRHGRPRGAGTGFVFVRRYRAATWRSLLRARFTEPRSASLAERDWNLFCHLRQLGVGTADPLAVASEQSGIFARCSFLVTRELSGMLPAPRWFRETHEPARRRAGLRSVGLFVSRLSRSGVDLPRLCAEHLFLSHGTRRPDALPQRIALSLSPEVALASVRGGRLTGRARDAAARELLQRLDRTAGDPHPLTERERASVLVAATRDDR